MFSVAVSKIKATYKSFPVVVHPLFLCCGVYCLFVGLLDLFLVYTISAILHELGHFFVARRLGYKMLQVRIMPYGAELCGELDEFLYIDDIKIALAGPVTSFCLAILVVCLWWLFPSCYEWTCEFCKANIVCAVFNILPIYPLDGGRILVSCLSLDLRRKDAIRYAKNATKVFSFLLFGLFILSIFYSFNLIFGFVAIMLYVSTLNTVEECNYVRIVSFRHRQREIVCGIEVVELVVSENAKLYKVYAKLKAQKFYRFVVVDFDLNIKTIIDERFFADIKPEEFVLTFKEILLLKYNKNMPLTR